MKKNDGKRLSLLLVNDDGIDAAGLAALAGSLGKEADIYVAAPHAQRSASGHAITIGKPFDLKTVEYQGAAMAIELTGTPADCVKMGIRYFENLDIEIDMVFSGINHGANLGTDTLYSGTVSAAIEGAICGKPSVAVSVGSHTPTGFDYAANLALDIMKKSYGKLDSISILNVNVPDIPQEKIKGTVFTRLGRREYKKVFKPHRISTRHIRVEYAGIPIEYDSKNLDIDVIAQQSGYASVTPLRFDLTNHYLIEEVKKWRIGQYE